MNKVFIIFLLFLTSCGGGSTNFKYDYFEENMTLPNSKDAMRYYEKDVIEIYEKYKKTNKIEIVDKKDIVTKMYCAYNTFYIIYLNPWNLRFSNEGYLEKYMNDLKVHKIKDIKMTNTWFTLGIIGSVCTEIEAIPIYNDIS